MKDQLIFDTTDFDTINDSDSVGAFVRSGAAGALVTHHSPVEAGSISFDFVDGDVTVGTDAIAETAHGLQDGDVIQLTSTGALPTGLSASTDYYVIRVDANSFKLAESAKDAEQGVAVDITAVTDAGATHTVTEQETSRRALDVWLMNEVAINDGGNSITVDASQLDIDDLNATDDAVASWTHDGSGTAITSTVNGGDTGLDVNIINAADIQVQIGSEYAEDAGHTTGDVGSFQLSIRMDDVDGTNTDFIADTEGDYQGFFTNAKGELHVRDNDVYDQLVTIDSVLDNIYIDTQAMVVDLAAIEVELLDQGTSLDTIAALSKAEDAVHNSGDTGVMSLAVRNDTLASLVDADGDYAPLQVDASGALYTYISGSDPLTVNDSALANTAIANAANALGAANTAEDVVASPLANRKYLYIYNSGNKKVYVGATGVSAATGFPVSPGSYLEMRAGASVDVEWVSADTSQEIRTLELS
jgi:hypothetical protein